MVSNIPAILGAVVSVLCVRFNMPELLMIGRFITGINCGMYVRPSVSLSV